MATLALKVLDESGKTVCVSSGEDYVSLVCTAEYKEGDRIVLETSEKHSCMASGGRCLGSILLLHNG